MPPLSLLTAGNQQIVDLLRVSTADILACRVALPIVGEKLPPGAQEGDLSGFSMGRQKGGDWGILPVSQRETWRGDVTMPCPYCAAATTTELPRTTTLGYRMFRCRACRRTCNERTGTPFNHLQVPTDIVQLVVLWRLRYKLSLRNVAEMFLTRGFTFTHETVRAWEERFAPLLTAQLKAKRRRNMGRTWHVDETYIKVEGHWCYLYRAIDSDGNLVEAMLSTTRDMTAAKRFFACALETAGQAPEKVTTDGHDAYPACHPGDARPGRPAPHQPLL